MALWIAAIGAAIACLAIAGLCWQASRLLKAVQSSLQGLSDSVNPSLLQLQELLQEAGSVVGPVRESAQELRSQLQQLLRL